MHLLFSPLAEADLEAIADYIAQDNPRRAIEFINKLRNRCCLIASSPYAAPLREQLGTGIRMAPFEHYLIFYTVHDNENQLRIERILHGARDIDRQFFE